MPWTTKEAAFEALSELTVRYNLQQWPVKGVHYFTSEDGWRVFVESADFKLWGKAEDDWELGGHLTTPLFNHRLHISTKGVTPSEAVSKVSANLDTAKVVFEADLTRLCGSGEETGQESTFNEENLWDLLQKKYEEDDY